MARGARKRNPYDYHHILYQRKHWQQGWAKILREHPYCGAQIPRNTLHRAIHAKISTIPLPVEGDCKKIFNELCIAEKNQLLSNEDSIGARIDFILERLSPESARCREALQMQKDIVAHYQGE